MHDSLPSIILEDFTEEVLDEILKIYSRVARIKNPNKTTFNLESGFIEIYHAMCARQVCEFRFGSAITRHSKLYLYPVFKRDGQHVAFDFDPNTADDSQRKPVEMREKFHKEVQKYLDTLPQSID